MPPQTATFDAPDGPTMITRTTGLGARLRAKQQVGVPGALARPAGSDAEGVAMRKLLLVVGAALLLLLGTAPAVQAVDYPPTTAATPLDIKGGPGSTVSSGDTVGAPNPASTNSSLPFTGGDSGALVWLGLAFVGAGVFAISSYRRRTRAS